MNACLAAATRLLGRDLIAEPFRTMLAGALVLGTLAVMFIGLLAMRRRWGVPTEITRKLLHVAMGMVIVSFPWLFGSAWPVVLLAICSVVMLSTVKMIPALRGRVAGVVHDVERPSLGEVYYPIAVAVLFVLARGNWLLFVIPILVLALGDALAALIGVSYGRVKYLTSDGTKSIEGSVAFFAVTFLAVHVPLLLFANVGRAESLLIALMIGILVAMLEAIAWQGLDNLFIPLGTWTLLTIFVSLPADALVRRFVVTVTLAVIVFFWRGRSTMDDSALTATVFFGYVVMMVGGWLWIPSPLALFLVHITLYPRAFAATLRQHAQLPAAPREGRMHTVRAILAVCMPSILCLIAGVATGASYMVIPHAAAFSAQTSKIAISTRGLAICNGGKPELPWLRTGILAWLGVFVPTAALGVCVHALPGFSIAAVIVIALISLMMTLLSGGVFCRVLPWLYTPEPRPMRIDLSGMALTTAAAAVVWMAVVVCHK